jgi:hypothetical protein
MYVLQEKSSSSLASQAQGVPGVAAAATLLLAQQRQWIFTDFGGMRMKSDYNGKSVQEWLVICLADLLSHTPELRSCLQPQILRTIVSAKLESSQSAAAAPPAASHGRFDHYSNYNRQLNVVQPHQALALLRGEKESALKLSFVIDVGSICDKIQGWFWRDYRGRWQDSGLCKLGYDIITEGYFFEQVAYLHANDPCLAACGDSAKRLVVPWMKRAALRHLRNSGDKAAKQYFASNLRYPPPPFRLQLLWSNQHPFFLLRIKRPPGPCCCSRRSKANQFLLLIRVSNTDANWLQYPAWDLFSSVVLYTLCPRSHKQTHLVPLYCASSTHTASRAL